MPGDNSIEIRKISLEITVTSDGSKEKIDEFNEATKSLQATIKGLVQDFKGFDAIFKEQKSTFASVTKQAKSYKKELAEIYLYLSKIGMIQPQQPNKPQDDTSSQDTGSKPATGQQALDEYDKLTELAKKRAGSKKEIERQIAELREAISKSTDSGEIKKNLTQLKQLQKEAENVGKSSKKSASGWGKLLKSIGRIALYRMIRAALKQISQAVQEGIKNIAVFDSKTNTALSNIKSSFTASKNAFGSFFSEIILRLEPTLVKLGDALTDFGNHLSMVMAKLNGESTYKKAIKVNEDYARSLGLINSELLSFDKFETLSKGATNPASMFEEVDISESWDAQAESLKNFTTYVRDAADAVSIFIGVLTGDWDSVKQKWNDMDAGGRTFTVFAGAVLLASTAAGVFKVAMNALKTPIGSVGLVLAVALGTFAALDSWMSTLSPKMRILAGVFIGLAGAILAVAAAIAVAKGVLTGGAALAGLIATGIGVGAFVASMKGIITGASELSVPAYANGTPAVEDGFFYANHSELIGGFKNGKTAVANNQQIVDGIAEGIYPAVYDAVLAAMKQSGGNGVGDVYIDKEVAGRVLAKPVFSEGTRLGIYKKN